MKTLVTVGSMRGRSFIRLFHILDELCRENVLNGAEVTAQTGYDVYQSECYKTFDYMGDTEFKELLANSDLIITHAGTGTVTSALKARKKVILFPRLSKYDEHYDDHQLELCDLFVGNGLALCAQNKEELKNCILALDDFQPKKFVSNKENFNQLILDSLSRILADKKK